MLLGLSLLSGCAAGGASPQARASGGRSVAPASALAPYLAGRFAEMTGHLNEAASLMLAAYRRSPDVGALRGQTFLACLMAGRPEAGDLAASLPDNPLARMMLGNQAAARGDWQAARAEYAAVKAGGVSDFLVPLLTAWTLEGGHDTDGALALLAPKATDTAPLPSYALAAALIADLGDRYPQAQSDYDLARQSFGGLNLRLAQILANWDYRQGHVNTARALLADLGRRAPFLALAVPALTRDLATRPVRNATDGLAETYLSFATDLEAEQAADKRTAAAGEPLAEAMLRLALRLRPDFTAARLLLADIMPPNEAGAAMALLRDIPASDPLMPIVQIKLATMEDATGATAAAETRLQRLIAAMPDQTEPLAALGDMQLARQDYGQAIATYGRAIGLNPSAPSAWTFYYARANAEQLAGNWPAAEADLKQALALSPNEPSVLNFLGFSWADHDVHLNDARRMLTKAVKLQPDDGAIIDSLGWVELRQGDVTDAVRELEKAVHLDPADPEINGHLGDAYWAAGRKLQARYQWQLALALKPDRKAVPKLEAKLQTAVRETSAPPQ